MFGCGKLTQHAGKLCTFVCSAEILFVKKISLVSVYSITPLCRYSIFQNVIKYILLIIQIVINGMELIGLYYSVTAFEF